MMGACRKDEVQSYMAVTESYAKIGRTSQCVKEAGTSQGRDVAEQGGNKGLEVWGRGEGARKWETRGLM